MHKQFLFLLKQHKSFLIPFLIYVLFGIVLQVLVSKKDLFLWSNQYYNPFWDGFFMAYTWLGDGLIMVGICVLLVFLKYRLAVAGILSYVYSSLVAQVIKHIFALPRPRKFFDGIARIRTIDGYSVHEYNSFPSGHSVTAFALAVFVVYLMPKKQYGWLVFLLALPVAMSRVYLAQHFFQDVFAGSILGTILTFQLLYWLENKKWFHSPKLEGRLKI